MKKIRILYAEDLEMVRTAIVKVLTEQDFFEAQITEASDGKEVLEYCQEKEFDVVILGDDLKFHDEINTAKELCKKHNKIIMFSRNFDEKSISGSLSIGVLGYILKASYAEELIRSILAVYNGQKFFSNQVSQLLLNSSDSNAILENHKKRNNRASYNLKNREVEIVRLMSEGYTDKEIADKLYLSHRTISNYKQSMMDKFNLKNSNALVSYAYKVGILNINY